MEKKMENEMETGVIYGAYGDRTLSFPGQPGGLRFTW